MAHAGAMPTQKSPVQCLIIELLRQVLSTQIQQMGCVDVHEAQDHIQYLVRHPPALKGRNILSKGIAHQA